MDVAIIPAVPDDAPELAALHAESWRSAYRGMMPDSYLDGPIRDERLRFWQDRMNERSTHRRLVLKAVGPDGIAGFVCVLLDVDPECGARLENLHIRPTLKGQGIGLALFERARAWVRETAPGQPMHLWVLADNQPARRFYDRRGGVVTDQKTLEVVPGIFVAEVRYVWQME
jgi:GNAT superfamily N-acetyltransferase